MTNKTTHTIHDIDALILEKVILLKTEKDKVKKEKLRSQIQKLEKHFNDCNDKTINGKKYKEREDYKSDKPMNKKELLKLIDSTMEITDVGIDHQYDEYVKNQINDTIDLSGVSVGKDRFIFTE